MEIPHNPNFAHAMFGFREFGAEIVPYHEIREIYDQVSRDDIVIDYIEQCNTIFQKFGAEPKIPDYPEPLKAFLGRKVWRDTINHFSSDEALWSAGYFVKPTKDKVFTGKIIQNISDLVGCGSCYEDYEILISEPVDIVAEWRCFIAYDEILDVRPYGSGAKVDYDGYLYHYDRAVLQEIMETFTDWDEHPTACSIDICKTKNGRTLLVELNDAYSLGCYGLPGVLYARMISARWSELLDREDEFKM